MNEVKGQIFRGQVVADMTASISGMLTGTNYITPMEFAKNTGSHQELPDENPTMWLDEDEFVDAFEHR